MSSEWYRRKNYTHFDRPLSRAEAEKYVSDPQKITKHSFLPFLSFDITVRRFNKDPKTRGIKYASHIDGLIFSYYKEKLAALYEVQVSKYGLSKVVLAYRGGIGNNIDFAKEAFDQITAKAPCTAIGLDLTSFFDSIDHNYLKSQWAGLLTKSSLPSDHYAVFKAITRYSHVDRNACYKRLNYSRKEQKLANPICDINVFRSEIRGKKSSGSSLIVKNRNCFGIPQGSSISAFLANLYMLEFDKIMNQYAIAIDGIYRRYSDDILFICHPEKKDEVPEKIKEELDNIGSKLVIKDEKTTISHFIRNSDESVTLASGSKPFQYLGFTFDGSRILIRSQSMSKYWRKVIVSVRKARRDAINAALKNRNNSIFLRKLYKRYTHLGKNNFIAYAKRSAIIMNGSKLNWKKDSIAKQIRRHWKRLNDELS